jgi:hypothetical protein
VYRHRLFQSQLHRSSFTGPLADEFSHARGHLPKRRLLVERPFRVPAPVEQLEPFRLPGPGEEIM